MCDAFENQEKEMNQGSVKQERVEVNGAPSRPPLVNAPPPQPPAQSVPLPPSQNHPDLHQTRPVPPPPQQQQQVQEQTIPQTRPSGNINPDDDGIVKYFWKVIDEKRFPDISLPYIERRNGVKYLSVRIIEATILSKFENNYSKEVIDFGNLLSESCYPSEAKLLNEINDYHVGKLYGDEPFSERDVVVKLDQFMQFYEILSRTCRLREDVNRNQTLTPNVNLQQQQQPQQQYYRNMMNPSQIQQVLNPMYAQQQQQQQQHRNVAEYLQMQRNMLAPNFHQNLLTANSYQGHISTTESIRNLLNQSPIQNGIYFLVFLKFVRWLRCEIDTFGF